jgi:cytochrome c biogenesis protein CcmG/thiol:disulfide interchange protein DsbE
LIRSPKLTIAVLALLAVFIAGPAGAGKPQIGQPAPDFKVTLLDGKQLTLADFKGEVLVINYWATWCGPCRRELPLLDAYYKVQGQYGLRVLFVTTDDSAPLSMLKPLAKVMSAPLARRFQGPYGILNAVPTNYVIDRRGVVRYAKAGAFDVDLLNDLLVPLLREPALEDPAPLRSGPAAASASSPRAAAPRSG